MAPLVNGIVEFSVLPRNTVIFSSEFTTQPESQGILLGTDLVLHCDAVDLDSGLDPNDPEVTLTFSWLLNGRDIGMLDLNVAIFPNHTLYVPRISTVSLGAYECLVTDDSNNATETSLTATVVEACK